jgi:hypothetical protein
VALVLGGLLAALSAANPAVAFFSGGLFLDVQVESPARLVAKGAAVDVPLEVTCNAAGNVFLEVSVTERSGSSVAEGFAFLQVPCAGSGQHVVARVSPSVDGKVFKQGSAVVNAEVSGCRAGVCGNESDSEVVDVRR